MTTTQNKYRRACEVALILSAGLLTSTAALSAEPEAQVTIRAERPTAKVVGHTSSGVPIEQYELSYHVSLNGLDLTTSAGADSLKTRVHDAADSLCKDLDKLYPLAEQDNACVRKAQAGAMSQVNRAISMAQSRAKAKTK